MRLLLVEDERDLATAIIRALARDGHAIDAALSIAEATDALLGANYDVVILDLVLPDGNGLDLLRDFRDGAISGPEHPPSPPARVLILTARSGIDDRVLGLDVGADDYLTKPFEISELRARVRALLRRDTSGNGSILHAGRLSLDAARHEVRDEGQLLALSPKEFAVLEYLMMRPDVVVSPEELLEHVWDANADPFTATVRVTVGTLRRKLTGPDGRAPILTVPRRGYRLVGNEREAH